MLVANGYIHVLYGVSYVKWPEWKTPWIQKADLCLLGVGDYKTREGLFSGAPSPDDGWILNLDGGGNLTTIMQIYPCPWNCTQIYPKPLN